MNTTVARRDVRISRTAAQRQSSSGVMFFPPSLALRSPQATAGHHSLGDVAALRNTGGGARRLLRIAESRDGIEVFICRGELRMSDERRIACSEALMPNRFSEKIDTDRLAEAALAILSLTLLGGVACGRASIGTSWTCSKRKAGS